MDRVGHGWPCRHGQHRRVAELPAAVPHRRTDGIDPDAADLRHPGVLLPRRTAGRRIFERGSPDDLLRCASGLGAFRERHQSKVGRSRGSEGKARRTRTVNVAQVSHRDKCWSCPGPASRRAIQGRAQGDPVEDLGSGRVRPMPGIRVGRRSNSDIDHRVPHVDRDADRGALRPVRGQRAHLDQPSGSEQARHGRPGDPRCRGQDRRRRRDSHAWKERVRRLFEESRSDSGNRR